MTKGFDSKNYCDSRTYCYITPTFAFAPVEEVYEIFLLPFSVAYIFYYSPRSEDV